MHNIIAIFKAEMRNAFSNIVTVLIMVGLVLLSALFAWFNLLACWDVFNNMGNLTVAVANTDKGYESKLFPMEINVGDRVISELRANDEINWVFVDEEEAIDGTKSGKYYAAVVIPEDFSQAMLTFYQDDAESAEIVYYINEKKNAISPKFTDQGTDSVSYQINQVFTEILADVSLSIAKSLSNFAETADLQSSVLRLATDIDTLATRLDDASSALELYANLADSAEQITNSSVGLVDDVHKIGQEASVIAQQGASAAQDAANALLDSMDEFSSALDQSIASVEELINRIPDISGTIDNTKAIEALDKQIAAYRSALEALESSDEDYEKTTEALQSTIEKLEELRDALIANDGKPSSIANAKERAQQALNALKNTKQAFEVEFRQEVQDFSAQVSTLEGSVTALASKIDESTTELSGSLSGASSVLSSTSATITASSNELSQSAAKMRELSAKLREALASNDMQMVKNLLDSNTDTLSYALAAPVSIERNAINPVESFGSAMTPFYSTLALFIGALVTMAAIRPRPSRRVRESLGPNANLKLHEEFFGHFGLVSVIAFAQSMVLGLGNLFFLQAQAEHPLLFLLTCVIAAEVFAFIMYALVVAFANLGKGIGVILLIVQVTGCGGSYPLQILPDFVQALSPFLPATHAVNAMREAMFGMTGNIFVEEIGILMLFAVLALILGLVLHKSTMKFMTKYLERVEKSKLMS